MPSKKRYLVLENGATFTGTAFGADVDCSGELVFNTGMSGYFESITDQSYNGEILLFTYPLIGNYGVDLADSQSLAPTTAGVVVHELARKASNWRNQISLADYLKQHDIPGISGIDTREVTKQLREVGTMRAVLVDDLALATELLNQPGKQNLIMSSSTKTAYQNPGDGKRIVLVDFGLKGSILNELSKRHCDVTVVPATTNAQEILNLHPDGVMLSNGPGDPMDASFALPMITEIEQHVPLFGICMGHQLFALANGAQTFKMKFGHRGFNHPVREIATNRVDFTAQNHGYAVDANSVDAADLMVTHQEINDQTVEGLRHKKYPAFSVQFHPDAAPGPHDASHLFDDFLDSIESFNRQQEGK